MLFRSRSRLAMLVRDKISEGTDLDIRKCFNSQTGASDGVFPGDFCVIRENSITGFLLEVGFLTNADDRGFMSDPAGQRRIAHAVADGIYEYFCLQHGQQDADEG